MITLSISYNEPFTKIAYNLCNTINYDRIDFKLNEIDIKCDQEESYNHEECWLNCIKKKLKFSSTVFDSMLYNDILIQCDSDMICVNSNKFINMIENFEKSDLDIIGMCEDEYKIPENKNRINGGFYLIKKNEKTKNLFHTMFQYNFCDYTFHDQDVMNIILKSSDINYDVLETEEFTLGCFLHNHIKNINNICLFHATCSGGNLDKQEMINGFLEIYGSKKIDWENLDLNVEVTKYKDGILV